MSLQQFIKMTAPKQAKYKNKKITVDGITFDSKKEYNRYCELKIMEKAGLIEDIKRQVKFELIPKQEGERALHYIADFVYYAKNGEMVVEDTKGVRTKEYIIKRKLMLWRFGIQIIEV